MLNLSFILELRGILERAVQSLGRNDALKVVTMHPEWMPNTEYTAEAQRPVGFRVRRGEGLYELRQEHTSQTGWEPENAPSLWERVCEEHSGSADDPIPYKAGMALAAGLYYEEEGVIYRCIRDTGNPVYHALSALVGLYVERV